MNRVEANTLLIKKIQDSADANRVMETSKAICWNLGTMNSFLTDISKSLAVIADVVRKGDEK